MQNECISILLHSALHLISVTCKKKFIILTSLQKEVKNTSFEIVKFSEVPALLCYQQIDTKRL